jgi:2-polyprenyl-6-methoxyphenol hydroxylase-like FAD-dependent oxidoreductase
MEQAHFPAIDLPVIASPDVCVVGAGPAGVAAALGAARVGLSVLLIERYGFCGGATVAGLSGSICGLYSSGSQPEQIVFGFAEEFRAALAARGGAGEAIPFGRTKLVPHDSLIWKETADDLLQAARVRMLYHTLLLDVTRADDGGVDAMLLRGMEGLFAVRPRVVVDASGDAEVVHRRGGDTTFGRQGVVQAATMVFRLGGVDMDQFFQLDPRRIDAMITEAHERGDYDLPRHHVYLFPMPSGRELLCNMTRITFPDGSVPSGIRSADMTHAEIAGRRQARAYAEFLKARVPGFSRAYMVDTGAQVGIRQTRSIVGKQQLTNDDVLRGRKRPGAVTHSAWPIEAHGAGELRIQYLDDDYYDIPFEALTPRAIPRLLVAGRCLSAEHEALASARVTAQCFGMGYAAGAACGLLCREPTAALNGPDVAAWMRQHRLRTSTEHD